MGGAGHRASHSLILYNASMVIAIARWQIQNETIVLSRAVVDANDHFYKVKGQNSLIKMEVELTNETYKH